MRYLWVDLQLLQPGRQGGVVAPQQRVLQWFLSHLFCPVNTCACSSTQSTDLYMVESVD